MIIIFWFTIHYICIRNYQLQASSSISYKCHHITYIKIHTGAAVLQKQKQNQNHSQSSPKFGNAIYQMFANVDPKYIKKHCEFRASLNAYYILKEN